MKDPVQDLIRKVTSTISRFHMICRGERVIVAVSGGPDSTCLLDILFVLRKDLGIDLIVAHFNHGFRPGEDEAEASFVAGLAETLGLPLEAGRGCVDLVRVKGSLEEGARNARYDFLKRAKRAHSAQKIALGHHLNDQAETVLMKLLRGSGSGGLSGIHPVKDGEFVRPLITATRKEIKAYLAKKGLRYVTDSSNLEMGFFRNRIRLELLPLLERYQPKTVQLLGHSAEIMRVEDDYLGGLVEDWMRREACNPNDKRLWIPLSSFKSLPQALRWRVIRRAVGVLGAGSRGLRMDHVKAVDQMALGTKGQAKLRLPSRILAQRIYERLEFSASSLCPGPLGEYEYTLHGMGTYDLQVPGYSISLEALDLEEMPELPSSKNTAFLDADLVNFPLIARNLRPGDRFVPLGMTGRKKIKDFFIDRKVPSPERKRTPLLLQGHKILWVCGFQIDERFKVTAGTRRVLRISLQEG